VLTALLAAGLATPAVAYPGAPWFEPDKPYTGNFPDPDVLRVGSTYYAYGTATGGAYLPVMRSTDLQTWTARSAYDRPVNDDPYFNDALPVPASWGVDVHPGERMSKSVWAPGVERFGDTYVAFYAVRTRVSPPRYCISLATSSSPEGPFVDRSSGPLVCDADPAGSIDPDPFIDPVTGTPYLIWKSEGVVGSMPTRIWSRQLSPSGTSFAAGSTTTELLRTSQSWEGNVIENPSMIRSGGQLYLFYSGNEWASGDYATSYATCRAPTGPCTKARTRPLLASSGDKLGPGGAAAFLDTAGRLRLVHHWWNAPYTNYPAYPACTKDGSCQTKGQRRLGVVELSGSGTTLRVGPTPTLSGPSRLVPLAPARVLDTRSGLGAPRARVAPRGRVVLQVTGRGGVPASGVSAVVLNVTLAGATGAGFVQVYPTGRGTEGASSNLNAHAGQTLANLVTTPVGHDGKVTLYSSGGGHLVADVTGYYAPSGATSQGRFQPLAPQRLLDTRTGPLPAAGSSLKLQVAGRGGVPSSGASAVMLAVTATRAVRTGYVQVVPTGGSTAIGSSSNLNVVAGQTVANLVVVPVGRDGTVTLHTSGGTHLLADVAGWVTGAGAPSATTGLFVALEPTRVLDTRLATAPRDGGSVALRPLALMGVRGGASAVVLNVTGTRSTAAGFVQVLPTGSAEVGGSSNLNLERAGQTVAAAAIGGLGAGEQVSLYTARSTDLLADVSGYLT
jgi:hypothetical protein